MVASSAQSRSSTNTIVGAERAKSSTIRVNPSIWRERSASSGPSSVPVGRRSAERAVPEQRQWSSAALLAAQSCSAPNSESWKGRYTSEMFVAAAAVRRELVAPRLVDQFECEPGLPDARIALEDHQVRVSVARGFEAGAEPRQLHAAPDQRTLGMPSRLSRRFTKALSHAESVPLRAASVTGWTLLEVRCRSRDDWRSFPDVRHGGPAPWPPVA